MNFNLKSLRFLFARMPTDLRQKPGNDRDLMNWHKLRIDFYEKKTEAWLTLSLLSLSVTIGLVIGNLIR